VVPTFVRAEVEHHRALPPVVEVEGRAAHVGLAAAGDLQHPAERVADRRFHLDDVGSPVGQHPAGRRAGHPHPELHHAHTVQHGCVSTYRCGSMATLMAPDCS
jgi:hypothetical protein